MGYESGLVLHGLHPRVVAPGLPEEYLQGGHLRGIPGVESLHILDRGIDYQLVVGVDYAFVYVPDREIPGLDPVGHEVGGESVPHFEGEHIREPARNADAKGETVTVGVARDALEYDSVNVFPRFHYAHTVNGRDYPVHSGQGIQTGEIGGVSSDRAASADHIAVERQQLYVPAYRGYAGAYLPAETGTDGDSAYHHHKADRDAHQRQFALET